MIDEPPVDIAGYVEDVLPLIHDDRHIVAALVERGFAHWDAIDAWRRKVRDGKSGTIYIKAKHNAYHLEYWPVPSKFDHRVGLVCRTGNIRAILRATDRMIAAFEPAGWQQLAGKVE